MCRNSRAVRAAPVDGVSSRLQAVDRYPVVGPWGTVPVCAMMTYFMLGIEAERAEMQPRCSRTAAEMQPRCSDFSLASNAGVRGGDASRLESTLVFSRVGRRRPDGDAVRPAAAVAVRRRDRGEL